MAKTVAPLLSFSAGGQIAKTQVYASWKGRPYVRRYVVPANPNSPAQQETRGAFKFLMNVWKFFPGSATGAWALYANGFRITDRNAFAKANISPLRLATDLTDFTMSPSAASGLIAADMAVVPSANTLTVALTPPVLPVGWTITSAFAAAIRDQDPQTGTLYGVVAGFDESAPYSIALAGLVDGEDYVVGGWFQYTKPDGSFAYGRSLQEIIAPGA
jgi:hypothetical protein